MLTKEEKDDCFALQIRLLAYASLAFEIPALSYTQEMPIEQIVNNAIHCPLSARRRKKKKKKKKKERQRAFIRIYILPITFFRERDLRTRKHVSGRKQSMAHLKGKSKVYSR